jgi:hypothetical protein
MMLLGGLCEYFTDVSGVKGRLIFGAGGGRKMPSRLIVNIERIGGEGVL